MNIKTTISIIAIALSSMSMAEAGQDHHTDRTHNRSYEKQTQDYGYRHEERRKHWRHVKNHRHHEYRGERHHRKHAYYNRHNKHFDRSHKRHSHWNKGWKYGHNKRHDYRQNKYNSRNRSSHTVVVSGDPLLPVIAGGIVAAKIAKTIVRHDPILRTIVRHDPIARALFGH